MRIALTKTNSSIIIHVPLKATVGCEVDLHSAYTAEVLIAFLYGSTYWKQEESPKSYRYIIRGPKRENNRKPVDNEHPFRTGRRGNGARSLEVCGL